jgi:hypothetical protein
MCGILSSLLYVAMNVFVAMQWEGYSSASQAVSELSRDRRSDEAAVVAAPRIAASLPTPWMQVWERINIGVFCSGSRCWP